MYRILHFFAMSSLFLLGAAVIAPTFANPDPCCGATPCGDDHAAAPSPQSAGFEAGPHGTVKLGNAKCPVMGGNVNPQVGTAYNGWWINFCCGGCDAKLKADPDTFAAKLLEATGVDIRKSPAAYIVRPNRHFADGPEGTHTKLLGNATCPVMGGKVNPQVGTSYNGWWISFCCGGCDAKLKADVDKAAAALLAETGVDIRQTPEHYTSLPNPAFESGPDGSVKLGSAKCPVLGGDADPQTGAVINGWWVAFCCPGCDAKLKADLDKFAPALRERTGIDIRQSPLHYMRRPAGHADAHGDNPHGEHGDNPHAAPVDPTKRHHEQGPHGTIKLGNATCPVMDKPVHGDRGVAFNGWWVGVCCGRCERSLEAHLDKVADALKRETGIDIRKKPAEQGIHADHE
ncbi:MAG: hypothetical protein AB7K09_12570 [Planctomycetota bacterium]